MANVVKKEIYWDAPVDADVTKVRIYAEMDPSMPDYSSPVVEFDMPKTSAIVPDETPGMFDVEGTYNIGITFVDDQGNESDIATVQSPFDFVAPGAPTGVGVRTL